MCSYASFTAALNLRKHLTHLRTFIYVSGEVLYITTPRQFTTFRELWRSFNTNKHSLVMQVKACSDFHLMLTTSRGSVTDEAIDMVIGGWKNTKSVIRTGVSSRRIVDKKRCDKNVKVI